jgi:ADP-ribose pyrophosphatase
LEITLESRLLHKGKNFSFFRDEVELPNGYQTYRDIVKHPGAVAIVPFLPDGRILMVKQYRYAAGKELLEIPAGTLEPNEPIIECARRELIEETGYEAGKLIPIINCFMAPGYSSEVIHIFKASDLKKKSNSLELDETIIVESYEIDVIMNMIEENIIEDAKTIVGILSLFKGTVKSGL